MGHCAKYGSYTAMDLDRNKVLTVELVQSNQVPSSSTHMELKGLQKMVQLLNQFNITVTALVTDQRRQIQQKVRYAYMYLRQSQIRENFVKILLNLVRVFL